MTRTRSRHREKGGGSRRPGRPETARRLRPETRRPTTHLRSQSPEIYVPPREKNGHTVGSRAERAASPAYRNLTIETEPAPRQGSHRNLPTAGHALEPPSPTASSQRTRTCRLTPLPTQIICRTHAYDGRSHSPATVRRPALSSVRQLESDRPLAVLPPPDVQEPRVSWRLMAHEAPKRSSYSLGRSESKSFEHGHPTRSPKIRF